MQYQVVEARSKAKLVKQVQQMINNGWRPVGGVNVYNAGLATMFHQAMVKGSPLTAR